MFLYDNAGVPTLEAVAWQTLTIRSVPLDFQDGVRVKDQAPTRRYVGTIRPILDVNSQVRFADSNKFRHVWNVQNQITRHMGEYWNAVTTITGVVGGAGGTEPHVVARRFFVLGLPTAVRATGTLLFTHPGSGAQQGLVETPLWPQFRIDGLLPSGDGHDAGINASPGTSVLAVDSVVSYAGVVGQGSRWSTLFANTLPNYDVLVHTTTITVTFDG